MGSSLKLLSNVSLVLNSRTVWLLFLVFALLASTQFSLNAQSGVKIGLVADVAWSPDGSEAAVAAGSTVCGDVSNHAIKIIDAVSQLELQNLQGHTCPVLSVAWNPDGTELASTGQDSTIRIWDVATGQSRLVMEHGVTQGRFSLAWSPDGSTLVSLFDGGLWIDVWDAFTGQYLFNLEGHEFPVNDVAWSPDGSRLASGSSDHTVRVWDVETWTTTMVLSGPTASIVAVGWSPDGSKIASGGSDNTLRIWDSVTGQTLSVFQDYAAPIFALSWNPDGDRIATADLAGNIQIVSFLTGQTTDTIQTNLGPLLNVEWNPAKNNELAYFGRDSGILTALFEVLNVPSARAGPDQMLTDGNGEI